MGKFKIKTNTKGKRWIKGQSCLSNPNSTKHRDAAKTSYFHENIGRGNSLLTCDALKNHDIVLSSAELPTDADILSESGDTVKTFASDWTNCSNISFSRLLNGFQATSSHHKDMLAVLAAVTEVIKSQGGSETTNEYFGALITALDSIGSTEENVAAIMSLLKMCIRGVSQNIMRLKFQELTQTFLDLLNRYSGSENTPLLSGIIDSSAAILRAQDYSVWNTGGALDYFNLLLAFTLHTKPKVRKCAQLNVAAILKDKIFTTNKAVHPAASSTGDFCVNQLEGTSGNIGCSSFTTILHTLGLLKSVMSTFPRAQMKANCESILKVMTLGDPRVTICGLQALHGMLFLRPLATSLTPDLNARLISALFDFKPEDNDKEAILTWLTVMQEAYGCLAIADRKLCLNHIPRFAKAVSQLLEKDHVDLLSGSALALKTVVLECLDCKNVTPQLEQAMAQTVKVVTSCLRSQCHAAWKYVVHILGALYQVGGEHFARLLAPSLQKLAALREEQLLALGPHIDKAVGLAVHSMGPKNVLQFLPLDFNFEDQHIEFSNSWLLPVLRENIHNAELAFFVQHIYPLAVKCKKKSGDLSKGISNAAAHSFELLYLQLWALLPGFCNDPTDFEPGLKSIAKLMGIALNEKDLRIAVMAGLRKLVTCSLTKDNEGSRKALDVYSKNYLPLLFSIYTTPPGNAQEEGQRLAALETIKSYLQVTNPALQHDLFDRAFDKLSSIEPPSKTNKKKARTQKEGEFKLRDALLQLLMALLGYQNEERIVKVYDTSCILLNSEDHKEQKRGYRLIEELCRSESPACKNFVKENLISILNAFSNALAVTKPPSRASRLRCILLLIAQMEHEHKPFLFSLVPEAVLCCKDINEKCRSAAYTLLLHMGQALQRWTKEPAEEVVRQYLAIILPGLEGSVNLASATILALSSLLYEYGDLLPNDMIGLLMHNISSLVTCSTREIVGPCLSFYKAFLSTFATDICGPHLETLVKSLVNMNEDCKRHFRIKTRNLISRLVRRYGMVLVSSFIPQDDDVMLKRLKNINKILERKARERNTKQKRENSDDEDMDVDFETNAKSKSIEEILADSDDDDDIVDSDLQTSALKSKQKTRNAWIHEKSDSFLDFTDPTATRKIIATDPNTIIQTISVTTKDKNRGFKTAPDGRLIIKDDSDNSEEESSHPKKRKSGITIDSDDDIEDDEENMPGRFVLAPGNKRKRISADTLSESSTKYKAGGSGIHRPYNKELKKSKDNSSMHSGREFKAVKASGDIKKKGKPDPYAYIPLNTKLINRRKRAKQSGLIKRLATAAKKGAARGKNARAKKLSKRRS